VKPVPMRASVAADSPAAASLLRYAALTPARSKKPGVCAEKARVPSTSLP